MGFTFSDLVGLAILAAVITIPIVLWKRQKKAAAIIFVILFVLLLIANSIPSLVRSRTVSQRAACINNLQLIQKVKTAWAEQNGKKPSDVPSEEDLVGVGKPLTEMPECPAGGKFTLNSVNQNPTCSLADQGHKLE